MKYKIITTLILSLGSACSNVLASEVGGINFECSGDKIQKIEKKMDSFLNNLKISKYVSKAVNYTDGKLNYYTTNQIDRPTDIKKNFKLRDDTIIFPSSKGYKKIKVVSKAEITLAMMNQGRSFDFKGDFCSFDKLSDNINVRQNTSAWASNLEWQWVDGEEAFANPKYWRDNFIPKKKSNLAVSLNDMFLNQSKYSFGCNLASKIVMTQGLFDYYNRVKKDKKIANLLTERLYSNNDPLEGVDPDYDGEKTDDKGKILKVKYGYNYRNIVPGDWIYFENTDATTREKVGYEGSNSIYLGGDKFNDYYNDNNHSYSYEEKLDEVWQWRNEVFSRSRDAAKIKTLSKLELDALSLPPSQKGLLRTYRVTHYNFTIKNGKLISD